MVSERWQYDTGAKRYRDGRNGRFLARSTIAALRDRVLDRADTALRALATRVASDQGNVADFERNGRKLLKDLHATQYMLGRGGRNAMTASDWGMVGHIVRDQYAWLNRFAGDIAAGTLSAAQIEARAAMYAGASIRSAEQATAAAHGIQLTRHPGDGSTECKTNCRCHLDIVDSGSTYEVRWTLGAVTTEHCGDCLALSQQWAPLVFPKRQPV